MFDLEKKPEEPFAFDLEVELKKNPEKAKELLADVHERMNNLKNMLRTGANPEEFDEYGVLLHGYTAFERVLKRMIKQK